MSAFGAEPDGLPLSRQEVEALTAGTLVIIVWSGGNGPHRYTVADDRGTLVAATDDELARRRLDIEKALTGPIAFVGQERFHTRLWFRERA